MLWHGLGMLRGGSNISVVKAEASFRYSTLFPSLHHNFGLESWLSLKLARCILVAFAKTWGKSAKWLSSYGLLKLNSDWKYLLLISIFSPCLQFDWLSWINAVHSNTPALRKFHCKCNSPQLNGCDCRTMSSSWPMCAPLWEVIVPDPVSDACLRPSWKLSLFSMSWEDQVSCNLFQTRWTGLL